MSAAASRSGMSGASAGSWYALSVHTRSEHAAARELGPRVAEVFLPTKKERRAWSDRVVTTEVPLFPGYVFVRTALSARARVELLKVRQVNELVGRLPGDARIARAIPPSEIEALRIVLAAERAADPIERLVRGTHVLVATGPLRGARGVVEQGVDGQRRLVVQIELLGRGVRAVLTADDVVESLERAA
jgi:transcription termination/antitermination protein NusG